MNIIYVTTEYPLPTVNYGGIAVVFKNEVESLISKGHNVRVILISNNNFTNIEIPPYIILFHFPSKGKLKGIRGRFRLTSFINNNFEKDNIIVTADFGGILPFKLKQKKIVQLHESGTLKRLMQGKKKKKLLYFLEYFNLLNACKIRSVSNSVLQNTYKAFPLVKKIKAEVIYNGISGFKLSHNEDELISSFKNNVIFIGKLSELKGVDFLPEIINGVHDVFPNAEFTLIGHDECKNGISNKDVLIKKIKNVEKVIFFERIENHLIVNFLINSSALILPSKTEALPMVIIEAFSCSVPVVAFNVGGNSEIIDNGVDGYLIEPFNIKDFVLKLCLILSQSPETTEMGRNAFRKYTNKFMLENTMKKLEKFYLSI